MTPREKIVEDMVLGIPEQGRSLAKEIGVSLPIIARYMLQVVLDAIERGEICEIKQFKHEYANKTIQDWYSKIVIKEGMRK